jgi:CubicO group peptidase (beta-lactamase class C family)
MAALTLVERGFLGLDENVNKRLVTWKLPENDLTQGHPVTLRWLLSHRAGLTVPSIFGYPPGSAMPTLVQVLDGKAPAQNPPVRVEKRPGSTFQYSGGGYCIVQLLLEDITGCSFPDLMRDTVLGPLEMTRSTFEQPLPEHLRASVACGHAEDGSPVPESWRLGTEMAAGGLWSTPSDLARFAIEIQLAHAGRSRRLLSRRMTAEMLSAQGDGAVGLGPFIEGSGPWQRFSHAGTNEGYQCELVAYASRAQGAVVMTNSQNGHRLVTEILGGIADVYGWPDYLVEKTVVAVAPALLERYVGEYDLGMLKVTIRRDGERLLGNAEGWGEHELYAESESDFFLTDLPVRFAFILDAAGEMPELVLRAYGAEVRGKGRSK